jgi:SAM-dependent methyltransferase
MKSTFKRIFRVIGFLVSVLCCVYVGKEIFSKREIFQNDLGSGLILALVLSCFLWVLVNVALGVGWRSLLSILGEHIGAKDSVLLSFRTQVAKYLPGNVFHHLGRAVLAKNYGVSIPAAGIGVVFESLILVTIAAAFGISFLFRQNYFEVGALVIFGILVGAVLLFSKTNLKQRFGLNSIPDYKNTSAWLTIVVSYSCVFFLQAGMFISFATVISEAVQFGFFEVLEMVSIAWAAGFVVLGAPGGLGVREAVYSTFAPPGQLQWNLLYIAALMRVSSIIGDFICFCIGGFFLKSTSKKESLENHEKQLEEGIFIGNQIDKSNLSNPIARKLVSGFDKSLFSTLDKLNPRSVHEIGCGEGRLTRIIRDRYGIRVLASDFSEALIEQNILRDSASIEFMHLSIYDLKPQEHRRDVVVCCEVLEHLENPELGLAALRKLEAETYILSVPNEPTWRFLNMLRLKYLGDFGNTPGHLNHWNPRAFNSLLAKTGFRVVETMNPFPWIMVLVEPC